jgi:hypothetical protein
MVLLAVMAVGAQERGHGATVVRMEASTRAGGARVSGGVNDPDVFGFWFQESLPLCMVITPYVLFFCLFWLRGSALILTVGPFDWAVGQVPSVAYSRLQG